MRSLIKKITDFRFFYEIIFLAILSCFAYGVRTSSTDYYFSFLLFDYSHGYMTRGFVGEVLSLFTGNITESIAYGVVLSMFILLSLATLILLGRAIQKSDRDFRSVAVLIALGLVLSPTTFRWLRCNGMQSDLFFYTFTMLAMLFVKHKYLRWSVPVFAGLATLCSVTYPVHCMVLLAIALLYEFLKEKNKASGILCILTYGVIIGIALFAVASRSHLGFQNADELYAYIASKTTCALDHDTIRYYLDEYFLSFGEATQKFIASEIRRNWQTIVFGSLFVYVPFASMFAAFWGKCIKVCKKSAEKIPFVLAIAELFLAVAPSIYTGEPGRWLGAGLVVEFGLLLYFLADKNTPVQQTLSKWMQTMRDNHWIPALAFAYLGLLLFL